MIKLVGLRAKTDACLIGVESENEKAKETKKCVKKRGLTLKNYRNCFLNNKIILNW